MEEFGSLEKMVQSFILNNTNLIENNKSLEKKVDLLEKENKVLVFKIQELEKKINKAEEKSSTNAKVTLDFEERQNLKNQINDLIEKIDYHIRS